jgi:hypothetical protein
MSDNPTQSCLFLDGLLISGRFLKRCGTELGTVLLPDWALLLAVRRFRAASAVSRMASWASVALGPLTDNPTSQELGKTAGRITSGLLTIQEL